MQKKTFKFLQISFLVTILFIGTFGIVKADNISVTASSDTMVYGGTIPTITATYNPSITPDTPAICSTTATSTSSVGSYPATCSGASDSNSDTFTYIDGSVSVTQATPIITWPNPADITAGTALSTTQLDATTTTNIAGTFAYTPDVGTILSAGPNQTLSTTFTPTDTTDYTTATSTTTINVIAQQNSGGGSPTPPTLNIQIQVDVPMSCSVTDTNGVVHNYSPIDSQNSYLAICALEAAIQNGSISSVQLSNQYPSLGLFITSINGVTADPNSQYWALYQNGSYTNSGIALLPVSKGDTIMFQLHDFSYNNLGSQVTLSINSLIPINTEGSESGGSVANTATITPIVKPTFDNQKALDFLISQQASDGSFDSDLYTDWAALALTSNLATPKINLNEITNYLSKDKLSGNLLTNYERQAMALMALGINPYNANGENYIDKIIKSFDGKQFGDPNEDNDDIFALIVLQNAGYTQNDSIINTDINFILSKQNSDGSWDSSVDITGATMEALSAFSPKSDLGESLTKAENYLKQNQKDDGSWNENASSTAWAIEGILAQNEKPENWTTGINKNSPLDYLATIQDTDGGVKDTDLQTKIWETSYVVSILSGKTWNQTMQSFDKENLPQITPKIAIIKKNSTVALVQKNKSPEVNSVNQNTASVLNAITSSPSVNTKTTSSQNWFERLLSEIF